MKDYYKILGVSPKADNMIISSAYRIRREHYTALNSDSGNVEKLAEITEAYKILSAPDSRGDYDKAFISNGYIESNPSSLYELLLVQKNADVKIIRYAYRFLAAMHHPDNPDFGDPVKFRMLIEAWRILSDEKKRAKYDKELFD